MKSIVATVLLVETYTFEVISHRAVVNYCCADNSTHSAAKFPN